MAGRIRPAGGARRTVVTSIATFAPVIAGGAYVGLTASNLSVPPVMFIGGGATLGIDYLREVLRPQAAAAAVAVGRDPAALRWSAVGLLAMDADRERARTAARAALCHLYAPLPHPYYEYTMREQGFGAAADALLRHMPAGRLDAAMAAIPEACIDALTIAGTPAECVARLQGYAGVIDEMLLLNCSPTTPDGVLASYREVMALPSALRRAQVN